MELKVYKEKKERKKKEPIYFKLSECNNMITLIIVDKFGNRIPDGAILSINPAGLHLKCDINRDIELPLDKENRIIINNLNNIQS